MYIKYYYKINNCAYKYIYMHSVTILQCKQITTVLSVQSPTTNAGSFPHPLRGVNTPNFRTTPPASGEKEGEGKGREGEIKERGKRKGRDSQGLVDTPCSKS